MVKVDGTVGHFSHRILGGCKVGLLGEHLADTAYAGHGHGYHNHHHGQHHKPHEQGHDIAEKTGEFTGAHISGHDELGAQPGGAEDAEIHGDHHCGVIEGQQAFRLYEHFPQCGRGLGEFLRLVVLPDEGLYHPYAGNVLLDAGVQVVIFVKDLIEYL